MNSPENLDGRKKIFVRQRPEKWKAIGWPTVGPKQVYDKMGNIGKRKQRPNGEEITLLSSVNKSNETAHAKRKPQTMRNSLMIKRGFALYNSREKIKIWADGKKKT